MSKFLDLTGKKFGLLTVIRLHSKDDRYRYRWECVCDCGGKAVCITNNLTRGHTLSCGCYSMKRRAEAATKHGQSGRTAEYRAWLHMKSRCYNNKVELYPIYGGRGITVCKRWLHSFENFFSDMGKRPSSKHSLDRIDVNGNYEPSNCRWATAIQQARNKRSNRLITFNGYTATLTEWAEKLNTTDKVIRKRIERGVPIDENAKTRLMIDLETGIFYYSIREAAKAKNQSTDVLIYRIERGKSSIVFA